VSALALAVVASGCADYTQLAYRKNDRVLFTAPAPRSLVTLPLTLEWVDKAPVSGQTYAVFVDEAPVRPGRTLKDVAGRDDACRRNPDCPDTAYLQDHGVYVTTQRSLVLPVVKRLAGSRQKTQLHQAIVVLLDAEGRRVGELSWYVQFKLEERTAG
jgi:hypothetical protein